MPPVCSAPLEVAAPPSSPLELLALVQPQKQLTVQVTLSPDTRSALIPAVIMEQKITSNADVALAEHGAAIAEVAVAEVSAAAAAGRMTLEPEVRALPSLAIETRMEESATSREEKKNCKPKIRKRDLGNEEVFKKKNRKPSAGLLEHAVVT